MPQTEVLTGIFVLLQREQYSQKKSWLTLIGLIAVWTVWLRFPRHATNLLLYRHTHPWRGFRNQLAK